MANPRQVYELGTQMIQMFPDVKWVMHFHNTRDMALANIVAAIQAGIRMFDGAFAGLGGCPFAPGASGQRRVGRCYPHVARDEHRYGNRPAEGHGYRASGGRVRRPSGSERGTQSRTLHRFGKGARAGSEQYVSFLETSSCSPTAGVVEGLVKRQVAPEEGTNQI